MITYINNCVLFPHRPNWGMPPSAKRVWQSEIAASLPGNETRQSLRAVARRQVTFTVTARTLPERARWDGRVNAATKSGLACAPLHGRAAVLAANVNAGANLLTLSSSAWNWQAGDYAILIADDLTFDMAAVRVVEGNVLTLADDLHFGWPAQALCWPLIFGKFSAQKMNALDGASGEQKITVAELTSARSVTIGNLPATVPGIGTATIGSTFIVQ